MSTWKLTSAIVNPSNDGQDARDDHPANCHTHDIEPWTPVLLPKILRQQTFKFPRKHTENSLSSHARFPENSSMTKYIQGHRTIIPNKDGPIHYHHHHHHHTRAELRRGLYPADNPLVESPVFTEDRGTFKQAENLVPSSIEAISKWMRLHHRFFACGNSLNSRSESGPDKQI